MMRESVGEVFQRTVSAVDKDAPLIRTPTIRSPLGVQWIGAIERRQLGCI
jgi:hypothetical protein